MLRATDVWFAYGESPVVRGVSVEVPTGGILGILGPNGSGKTTLLRLLAGTRQPLRGTITIDGRPLAALGRSTLARRMAVVPQETQLAFDYTVGEIAMMGRYPHLGAFEIEGPRDLAVIEKTLESTGTLHLKDRLFATLSGGEKQRVVIAAALAQIFRLKAETTRVRVVARAETIGAKPIDAKAGDTEAIDTEGTDGGYLLLDEPTASLDLGYQLEVAALLRRLHDDRAVSIVISTHDLGLAGTLCDRLVMIRAGEVVAAGRTDDVMTPENIRQVFGVEAEILRHPSGQRVVVPFRSTGRGGA